MANSVHSPTVEWESLLQHWGDPQGALWQGIEPGQEHRARQGDSTQLCATSKGWVDNQWYGCWLHLSKHVLAVDLQCHPRPPLQPAWIGSHIFSHLNMSSSALFTEMALCFFLINDQSAEIPVRSIFFYFWTDSLTAPAHNTNLIHLHPPSSWLKMLRDKDNIKHLTFWESEKSDSESSLVSSPIKEKPQSSCWAVLHFTGYCQQSYKDGSCFYNASCFARLFSERKLIPPHLSQCISSPECLQTSSSSSVWNWLLQISSLLYDIYNLNFSRDLDKMKTVTTKLKKWLTTQFTTHKCFQVDLTPEQIGIEVDVAQIPAANLEPALKLTLC